MNCSSRFGRLETSGCLIRSWHLHLSLWVWHQRHPRQHSQSFSVGHLPLASLVLLIITKLAVNLRDLWMTYIHSLLFFLYITAVPSHGIKSWSLILKFDARMLSSKHCWKHLICAILIKSKWSVSNVYQFWETEIWSWALKTSKLPWALKLPNYLEPWKVPNYHEKHLHSCSLGLLNYFNKAMNGELSRYINVLYFGSLSTVREGKYIYKHEAISVSCPW